jgi:hypothetical protein
VVAPITGPFNRSWSVSGPPNRYGFKPAWVSGSRSWSRQKKPFDQPLVFSYANKTITWFSGGDGVDYVSTTAIPSFSYKRLRKTPQN